MKKVIIFIIFIAIVVVAALIVDQGVFERSNLEKAAIFEEEKETEKPIRRPAVAGQFYPAQEEELKKTVDGFLAEANPLETKGYVRALIVPHAGYQYSGQVAAYGYKKLIGEDIDTVILIGNSHQESFDGISVYPNGYYKTPLGNIEIDSELTEKLINFNEKIFYKESAHLKEHSLEVQLPFLQRILKDFRIVPIIMGNRSSENIEILVEALSKTITDNTLLIASSDMSHYPSYNDAKYADGKVIKAILTGEVENLEKTIDDLEKESIPNASTFLCAEGAIKTIMLVAKKIGANNIDLLNYANSGDLPVGRHGVTGDTSRIVGYSAIVFSGERQGDELNKEEQKRLLEIARETVEGYIRTGQTPRFSNDYPALEKHLGVFVTLKKHGQLRGCIGNFEPAIPLYEVVIEMAIAAATKDTRFYPVREDELDELEYEISVLSPLKRIDSWREIEIGRHGVQIVKGFHSGVFLPQVATENNWDLDTFMSVLCQQKAGLPADCWKEPETAIYVFTAQVFGEEGVK